MTLIQDCLKSAGQWLCFVKVIYKKAYSEGILQRFCTSVSHAILEKIEQLLFKVKPIEKTISLPHLSEHPGNCVCEELVQILSVPERGNQRSRLPLFLVTLHRFPSRDP